ncbi:hypothetical protein [Prosthecobacter sp.]|uniref:hypothetical protein n=1 Tax=Prosthecobacter sp. TaxID=1965333 RepID=UPI003784892C
MHTQLLVLLPRPQGDTAQVPRQLLEASDWAVLFTLGTLLFLLGAFAMWAWLIWRRTTRPEPHVKLLMELEEEAAEAEETGRRASTSSSAPEEESSPPKTAPWEQSADWWKKADS